MEKTMGCQCSGGVSIFSSNTPHNDFTAEVSPSATPIRHGPTRAETFGQSPLAHLQRRTPRTHSPTPAAPRSPLPQRVEQQIGSALISMNREIGRLIQQTSHTRALRGQNEAARGLQRQLQSRLAGNVREGGADDFRSRIDRITAQVDRYRAFMAQGDRQRAEESQQLIRQREQVGRVFEFEANTDNYSQPFDQSARSASPSMYGRIPSLRGASDDSDN
ncbi:hypothetical protein EVC45_44540 [Paraburkholderia sp. UYCP14C]|uniref:hypothetical protein n=1 Tax=Paraburkholderia sp. UYCP14C TaxID=2511130 RepID=UPI0010EF0167|nr:hypothetical protein [Paraburkholderia sp. UYCP14C]RZF23442.1 hypothetical protein EVC45_44540 [Paraburkholderia sp. UYCP14C]